MTAERRFEEALKRMFIENDEACIDDVRSAHAACVEEARREGAFKYRDYVESDPTTSQERVAYERGLREGAEQAHAEIAAWAEKETAFGYSGVQIAVAIRARAKGGDAKP